MKYPLDLRPQDEPMYMRGWGDATAAWRGWWALEHEGMLSDMETLRAEKIEAMQAVAAERERYAAMLKELAGQAPFRDHSWARLALATGARAVLRGRLLTDQEKSENLAKAFEEEGDHEIAAAIRKGETVTGPPDDYTTQLKQAAVGLFGNDEAAERERCAQENKRLLAALKRVRTAVKNDALKSQIDDIAARAIAAAIRKGE